MLKFSFSLGVFMATVCLPFPVWTLCMFPFYCFFQSFLQSKQNVRQATLFAVEPPLLILGYVEGGKHPLDDAFASKTQFAATMKN
jgi:hypothetical protein